MKYQLKRSQFRLKDRQIEEIINHTTNMRDRLIITLLYHCGFRASELADLTVQDFDFVRERVKIMGKGLKVRYFPLTKALLFQVENYIKNNLSRKPSWMFPSQRKGVKHLTRGQIYIIVKKAAERAGVQNPNPNLKAVNPHSFRHSLGHRLRHAGFNLREIADLLGHESIRTTADEYGRSTFDELSQKINQMGAG